MLVVQAFFADLLNGFALSDVPLILFQLFVAALIGLLAGWIARRRENEIHPALIAIVFALITLLSKHSIPLSLILVALALLLSGRLAERLKTDASLSLFLIAAAAGIGCGSGSVFVTMLAYVVLIFPLMWMYRSK